MDRNAINTMEDEMLWILWVTTNCVIYASVTYARRPWERLYF